MAYENIYVHDSILFQHFIIQVVKKNVIENIVPIMMALEYAGEIKIMVVKGTADISNPAQHKPGCITRRWLNA